MCVLLSEIWLRGSMWGGRSMAGLGIAFSHVSLQWASCRLQFQHLNKALVDITLRPRWCPLVSHFNYTPYYPRAIWPIVGMTSSTKPEVHNILRCCHRRIKPRLQLTRTENFVKFGRAIFEARANVQTDRHDHRNTWLPYRGRSNEHRRLW